MVKFMTSITPQTSSGTTVEMPKPEEQASPSVKRNLLQCASPDRIRGEVIGKIASSYYYIYNDVKIEALAEALLENESVHSLGVIDRNEKIQGIIVRKELFDLLGQQFGRDLYRHKSVEKIIRKVPCYNFNRNLFSVSEEISDYTAKKTMQYFLLSVGDKFMGIFSTRDMMYYLSDMTSRDLNLAKRLQRSIVKEESVLNGETFNIVGASHMAKGVGGDFYHFARYAPHKYILSVFDVSGKGISASLLSTIISGMVQFHDFNNGISPFVKKLNNYITVTFELEKFITGVILDFDDTNGIITIHDMGHSYIYILRNSTLHRIRTNKQTIPIGIQAELTSKGVPFQLKKDDVILIITDGVEEQPNEYGEEYGNRRLANILQRNRHRGLIKMKNELLYNLHEFRHTQPQYDDITMVMLEYTAEG